MWARCMCPRRPPMPLAPDRTPTHEPLNLEVMWDLSDVIDERRDGPVTAELLAAVAAEAGVPLSHAYVAASVDPDLDWQSRSPVTVRVCTGGCQAWGAVSVLERLLELRQARAAAGLETFDVVAVACLNTCDRPTAVTSADRTATRRTRRSTPRRPTPWSPRSSTLSAGAAWLERASSRGRRAGDAGAGSESSRPPRRHHGRMAQQRAGDSPRGAGPRLGPGRLEHGRERCRQRGVRADCGLWMSADDSEMRAVEQAVWSASN